MMKTRQQVRFAGWGYNVSGVLALLCGIAAFSPETVVADTTTVVTGASEDVAVQKLYDVSKLVWETNETDPPIGDPNAKKGGTFRTYDTSYPLTFRLVGPNSNDSFAGWNRKFTMDFPLVIRHPTTDNYIPWMATHWSVQDDHKTVFYKLERDAVWSDGRPITAHDYVFTWEMMRSPKIVDPYYNDYFTTHYASVEAIDDYTLKVVGAHDSWRPLEDFGLWAMPRHTNVLDDEWVTRNNLTPLVTQGPYTLTEQVSGQYVTFTRQKNWWGENKRYFQGMFNPDHIRIQTISDQNRAFDFFQKGEIDFYTITSAKRWATEMDFPALKNGWVHRKRLFIDFPQGIYGMAMNLEKPVFQNKDYRKALQYLFDFDELNNKMMFGAYYRQISAFTGSEYSNRDLVPYGFDPVKGREHLRKAGFTKRGRDGIFVDEHGRRAAFTFTYGSKSLEKHFTVIKQKYRRLGVDMVLQLLEPGTAFERGLERQFEMTLMSRTTNFYPSPHQYYASVFKKSRNNNNVWYYGTAYTDSLIDVFRYDMDRENRLQAMFELDAILQDEAFYIPFWSSPFIRFVYWDKVQWPEFYMPKRTEQYLDWMTFWIDEEREARLKEAMSSGASIGEDTEVDVDPYGVKANLDAKTGRSNSVLAPGADDQSAQPAAVPATPAAAGSN